MTAASLLLIFLARVCASAGQIFFKKAMCVRDGEARSKGAASFCCGIVVMAVGFFLWLGLLNKFPLSYLYPFEGIDHILLVVGASIFLKERATPGIWLGVLLISAGVVFVSAN